MSIKGARRSQVTSETEKSHSTTDRTSSIHDEKKGKFAQVTHRDDIHLDVGDVQVRTRTRWWKLWIPSGQPPPPRNSLAEAPEIPLTSASIFSMLTYAWVTPIMTLGYQRTLQATDLWKLDESYASAVLSKRFDESWTSRKAKADAWNAKLAEGLIKPSLIRRFVWLLLSISNGRNYLEHRNTLEQHWRDYRGKQEASIALSLNDALGCAIINFAKRKEQAKARGEPGPNAGIGVAMAIGLFFLTVSSSIGQHQFFWRSMVTGVMARATLIRSIYKRGVNLTGKARTKISNSDLMNHISTDVSRIDSCAQWFTLTLQFLVWTAPIQIGVCLIILIFQLGPSALAGFALFVAIAPLQERAMAKQFQIRKRSVKFTDQRAKTLLEVLGSMRVVKYFSYEAPFLSRIYKIRGAELQGVKNILISQSANVALAFSIPVLASTLAFVTYTHVTKEFDPAVIFASLSLFQLLRQPMMFLPRALSAISDARSGLGRLRRVFDAETRIGESLRIDEDLKWALQVENATFEWEESSSTKADGAEKQHNSNAAPFRVTDISMLIQRGMLVAIVGRVGSGKPSLLMALIGEMRKVSGSVTFGGRVAYCSQTAWIQNGTLRENILFGQEFDEEKYWRVIEQASLLQDLELLADGDLTEIGEKGVNLSGGQKQRINVARALYFDSDIVIMDDPLSAVDAHVGKSLFHDAILGALRNQGKTVIFVTHALHFLSYCDYIYTLRNGRVAEQGTFQQLIAAKGEFARLDKEFGGSDAEQETEKVKSLDAVNMKEDVKSKVALASREAATGTGKLEGKLIVKEHRTTGSISGKVYKAYFSAGRGYITAPLLVLALVLMQGSQITSSYTLVWWQANFFHRPFTFYQMLYAVLGISQSLSTFLLGVSTDVFSYFVSQNLHHDGILNIFHAPMSFFDTTPIFLLIVIVAVVIGCGYQYFAAFYRASAREVKRLDSMLRSLLYSHLSESLTGLPTLRTYGEIPRFMKENEYYIDLENRALFLTVTNQRWMAIRLDFCGAIMVFSVALFAVLGVAGISAAQIGLVLTYTTSLTQACGMLTRQTAEVENYLNSVERVVQYSSSELMEQEPPHEIPESKPHAEWPETGAIEFKDLEMRYRPGLPNVLRRISLSIRGGEKIGIVGRTGAGKSSITLALLRIVEYSGSITIDGVDIAKIGGTVRTALDPFSLYTDAHLWDALRRSYLVGDSSLQTAGTSTGTAEITQGRITLDTVIESEGSNLSVGERSLLSLARALVRDTRVVILDEATASVDLETDQRIQHTIQTEFRDRTLICIAHRLRTILSYDRILVLDSGNIVEFDSPLALFHKENGIFRSLCEKSNITDKDIVANT
ncbi:hypothetical protein M413DRAFT_19157 [Hebeloma cylindrosporum]|uniref:ABC protein n=1 Tax=Hebeloma cylindrosporum TaxID=76867 RepID=A0A0C2XRZ4_HEBCY|nr:hypothetical protein M413DRAFT_19157 [Hebeloma cylindrosporum h7]